MERDLCWCRFISGSARAADLDSSHEAAGALINGNLRMAVLVSVVHGAAMIAAGGILAWLVYRYLGLKFVSRSWFNLDVTWAVASSWWGRSHSRSVFWASNDPHPVDCYASLSVLPERLNAG